MMVESGTCFILIQLYINVVNLFCYFKNNNCFKKNKCFSFTALSINFYTHTLLLIERGLILASSLSSLP